MEGGALGATGRSVQTVINRVGAAARIPRHFIMASRAQEMMKRKSNAALVGKKDFLLGF